MTDKVGLDDLLSGGGTVKDIAAMAKPADAALKSMTQQRNSNAQAASTLLPFTQLGAARRLEKDLAGEWVWCPKVKWHGWVEREGVWVRPAEHLLLLAAAEALRERLRGEERQARDLGGNAPVMYAKFVDRMQDVGGVKGAMKFLEPIMQGSWDQFDQDPNKLTVANGTLVFGDTDVVLMDHNRGDFITKKSPVSYDPSATCPFWMSTLEAFVPKKHMRLFLQRLAGSLLTAVGVTEQRIPFFHGNGGCGKSTFAQGMSTILGEDLAVPVDPATIRNAQKSGSSASPDLFALLGSRIVIAEEAEDPDGGKGQSIDVGMIKRWSGGTESTKIVARPMYGDVVKFMPTFTLILIANNAPDFKDQTDGIWRRLLVIPFNEMMPEDRKMKADKVAELLRNEASGILNWALEGYREWRRQGLNPPDEVLLAGRALREEQDYLGNFLRDTVHEDENGFITSEELHEAYLEWRGGDKEIPDHSQRKLSLELTTQKGWPEAKPGPRVNGKRPRGWKGYALGAEDGSQVEDGSYLEKDLRSNKTAGQSPLDLPWIVGSQDSTRVNNEASASTAVEPKGFSENLRSSDPTGVKVPLTCGNVGSQLSEDLRSTPSNLPQTHSFSGDDAWRRLYRRGEG